jgi:MoaA/NifB/PqqE/SkfB family radical SAM enzyme
MPQPEILESYRASRDQGTNTRVLCHAPFVSLNFEQSGRVTACCYNRDFVLGTYPEQSVAEIWAGGKARILREAFLEDKNAPGCDLCFHQLESRNFGGVLMRNFDRYGRDKKYRPEVDVSTPRVLEFEISNTCNLECVMCGGKWSSSIRANREKLPPVKSPYDRAFVEQIDAFLPSIAAARFLGGEPLLIKRYYEIWERFRDVNPKAELTITTNATIIPPPARALLEELRFNFAVSLDAVDPTTFEAIRKNARFDDVMANLDYFLDYRRRRGTWLSITACPMTYNWRVLPEIARFCEERRIGLYFNTVFRPVEASLGALPPEDLLDVIDYLEGFSPAGDEPWISGIRHAWNGLLTQLRGWHEDKRKFFRQRCDFEADLRRFATRDPVVVSGFSGPNSFVRVLSPLVQSLLIERESRSRRERHLDFQNLLPRTPIQLGAESASPSTLDLILGTHLLCRFLDGVEDGDGGAGDTQALVEQQRLLRQYYARLAESGEEEDLDRWLRERIRDGEAEALVRWMRALLPTLVKHESEWQDSRRDLAEGLAHLRRAGLDESGCQKVAILFESLRKGQRPSQDSVPWMSASVRQVESESDEGSPHIGDLNDLRLAMDAMYIFFRCYESARDPEAFRRRLDWCLDTVSAAGKVDAACRMLGGRISNAYGFLAHAPDDEVKRHIGLL